MGRKILHCDFNNFFAAIECLYNPEIRDKPVIVGGSQEKRHGIVLAKNYIAKQMGVKTGEAIWQAKRKCPNLIIIEPHYDLYLRFSREAREIYSYYTDRIESFGIDECWLDVTESTRLFGSAERIAYKIKDRIKEELGITVSIGVSFNKIFAKLGSDIKKPDAVTVITEDNFKNILWKLPVEDLLYVGPSTKKKLNKVAIITIGDLANAPLSFLKSQLGKWGETLWYFANGMDNTPVAKLDYESAVKGIGNSMTAPRDLTTDEDVKLLTYVLAESVSERLRKHNLKGKTVQISIRDKDLMYIERQEQLLEHTFISREIATKAYEIFLKSWNWPKPIRSFGVRVTDLVAADTYTQLSLFENKRQKLENIDFCIDKIRKRFGHYAVQRALLLKDEQLNANPVEEHIIHPVSYFQ
ncbi:MAG: DNA polymerase IV [Clostridiaceae bacterium]|nr:DNA polymerase IV [Clostridiaceae bacterium]